MPDSDVTTAVPPGDLPADPRLFFSGAVEWDALVAPALAGAGSALERLGPSPFPRDGFPFLGFLASVYDHVAEAAKRE